MSCVFFGCAPKVLLKLFVLGYIIVLVFFGVF